MRLLCGDVGGTKTRLATCQSNGNQVETSNEAEFPSQNFESLESLIEAYLQLYPGRHETASFGIAGPVRNNQASITNLPWTLDSRGLEHRFGWHRATLLNDLEATAWGISTLAPKDFCQLHRGRIDTQGNAAVIAPGTGLGEAGIFRAGNTWQPFACEGGHCDFSPADNLEFELMLQLGGGRHPVSWEHLLSGQGLVEIHDFLRSRNPAAIPWHLQQALRYGDPAATISEVALLRRDPVCIEALDRFVSMLGRETGNLALKIMATGGVYIGGGIAPKILPALQTPEFLQAFLHKGPMKGLLAEIPLQVILNDCAALYGAALYGARGGQSE